MKQRLSSESGIAIGVVLFALAIIAVVAIAMSAGGNTMGSSAISIDRISADVKSQGDLILTKIRQCYTTATIDQQANCANNAWNAVASAYTRPECNGTIDQTVYYPVGAAPAGILVSSIVCPGYQSTDGTNLWTGNAPAMLPPPSSGLNPWYYVNAGDSGGRCIRIEPTAAALADSAVRAGLAQAANAYASNEYTYTPGSASQRFILWITLPAGGVAAANAGCKP